MAVISHHRVAYNAIIFLKFIIIFFYFLNYLRKQAILICVKKYILHKKKYFNSRKKFTFLRKKKYFNSRK